MFADKPVLRVDITLVPIDDLCGYVVQSEQPDEASVTDGRGSLKDNATLLA